MPREMLLAAVLAGFSASPVRAIELTDHSPCTAVATAFDSKNKEMIRQLSAYIQNTMNKMDARHTENGEPGIMAQLSDEGLVGLVAVVAAHCQTHPRETVYNATAFVYRGTRDLEMQFGAAK